MPSDPASTTRIPPPTARLLYWLHQGWAPPYIPQRTVTELRWQGAKLDLFVKRVLLDHDGLHVDCELPGDPEEVIDILLGELRAHPIEGRCDDGYTFSASDGVVVSEDVLEDLSSIKTRVLISCRSWELRAPRPAEKLWVGTVETPLARGPGNMSLNLPERTSNNHYRLAGQRDVYYLMREERGRYLARWWIAVEPKGAAKPDRDLVQEDLTNIAFSFGCPMYVSTLYGLDEGGAPVAVMGSGFGWRASTRPRKADPPVPREKVAPFYAALSAHLKRKGASRRDQVTRAIRFHLDALNDPFEDGFALKMQIAAQSRGVIDDLAMSADAGAAGRFFADISEADAQATIPELWPRFTLERAPVPQQGPIALVAIFADALRSKTGGLVTASLQPRPASPGEPAVFDLSLRSTVRSSATTVLFSITEAPGGAVKVTRPGQPQRALKLKSQAEVESFLGNIARDDKIRKVIQQLMLSPR